MRLVCIAVDRPREGSSALEATGVDPDTGVCVRFIGDTRMMAIVAAVVSTEGACDVNIERWQQRNTEG